ncbi:MAG: GDP-mannose 4,6-dehydratase [Chloroflexi bacterium]|nr:GDP-mannose 4,6-dehydratase [Chloroflexota bacterium]MBI3762172.1 GDP-mannose 4,6-dehydratase [Chloroflexota bacterium]
MRALITGVGGFAGSHLADALLARRETEVWGCVIGGGRPEYLSDQVQLIEADLRDPKAVLALLDRVRPDRIYHLAGQSSPQQSWTDPWDTLESNLRPQVYLFEAILRLGLAPRVLVVGSNEEYGRVLPEDLPVRETTSLRPYSPYGVSKVAQDLLALQYFLSRGLHAVRVRPSNHIGPRQNERFVAPAFARQIARIEAGLQPPVMRVGNLSARRDFTDVRDIARAYWLVLERGEPGEVYNVGSGLAVPVQAILDGLLALTTADIRVEVDAALLRPVDLPEQSCDPGKLRARTGWEPQITLEQTLRDLLDYERARLTERNGLES